jgi:hypothetical protein
MAMRAVRILIFILAMNSIAFMMNASGFNDHVGMSPETGLSDDIQQFDRTGEDEGFDSSGADVTDYLGFAVAAVKYFVVGFALLGATETALHNIGIFPWWVIFPVMNFLLRPVWTLAGIEVIRGVVLE